ncbi:nicotinate-nucleotide adenylyltransferase [Sporosarcina aquimarina]|uniref:Probable nicotinate-nucleotide adenylyltransferase n=1 Tax=Sporosarcina aquimarina TaxID=114975 RepID=A0ABU4FWC0_9BACL|nr:nicotinate-nucleotide adenylyltransferase [Sporosarcina aquimarina]MDW0109010.1 nicotinate-nucleotide adenylyltransferase [Sporosarcina aquimarina]
MRKIGILGGTFNPPHIGHLIMANEICDLFDLDEVRLMPTAIPPHKQLADTATAEQRLKMIELAVMDSDKLVSSAEEVNFGGVSYTVNTMQRLIEKEPDSEFYFIIGGDMVDSLHTWYRIDDLMEMVQFVGVGRPGTERKTTYPIQYANTPLIDVSSTLLRMKYAAGNTTAYLLPSAVDHYIRKEGLYGTSKDN